VIVASTLNFSKASRIIFDAHNIRKSQRSCEGQYFIVADEIIVEESLNEKDLPIITWNRHTLDSVPLDRGQAPSGSSGSAAGESGGNGAVGANGNPGYEGRAAPALLVLARSFSGGKLLFDFRGQNGGEGGVGQTGGDGGIGRKGRSASQSFFDCKRGPGHGGNGGNGGKGGEGGKGGTGGQGGTVLVISTNETTAILNEQFDVRVDGGQTGVGGIGGKGGREGIGAPEGEAQRPFCTPAGRDGKNGKSGNNGAKGQQGVSGDSGEYFLLQLPAEKYDYLLDLDRRR